MYMDQINSCHVYRYNLILPFFMLSSHLTSTAMDLSSHSFVLASLLLALIPYMATSSTHHHHHKSFHFSLYHHETVNKTGYIIVNGVEGGTGITETTLPFGTFFVFEDPLTVTANRSSKHVGTAEGTATTASLDGYRSISIGKVSLRLKNHKGSISIVGGTHNVKPSDHPVVGGTGDFLFVHGYVTSSPVDLKGLAVVYKIEFHLYWPPYPSQTS